MQDPQVKAKRIQNLALSFFLGASAGNWCTIHQPTIEEPYLEISYLNPDGSPGIDSRGKPKGRPFKLLNASARPHKKIRMTKYFAKCHADLLAQTIKLYDLKPNITPEELVKAYNYCIVKAETLIHFRLSTSEIINPAKIDSNKELRKLLARCAREILGEDYSTSIEKETDGYIAKLFKGKEIIAMTPKTLPSTVNVEKAVIMEMLKYISALQETKA